jgi:hypothetical protein
MAAREQVVELRRRDENRRTFKYFGELTPDFRCLVNLGH